MKNLERAEQVIASWVHNHDGDLDGLPKALEDAGLLMPDEMKSNKYGELWWQDAYIYTDGEGLVIPIIPPRARRPENVRQIAYRMLVKANEAEGIA